MNRQKFLNNLKALWKANGELQEELLIEDLLDDAATLGLDGASEMYGVMLEDVREMSLIKDIDPLTGRMAEEVSAGLTK